MDQPIFCCQGIASAIMAFILCQIWDMVICQFYFYQRIMMSFFYWLECLWWSHINHWKEIKTFADFLKSWKGASSTGFHFELLKTLFSILNLCLLCKIKKTCSSSLFLSLVGNFMSGLWHTTLPCSCTCNPLHLFCTRFSSSVKSGLKCPHILSILLDSILWSCSRTPITSYKLSLPLGVYWNNLLTNGRYHCLGDN